MWKYFSLPGSYEVELDLARDINTVLWRHVGKYLASSTFSWLSL